MHSASLIVGVCLVVLTNKALAVTQQQREQFEPKFKSFMKTYNKVYQNGVEHEYRFGIFLENMKKAEDLQKNQLGTARYGVTQFSDLTAAEFRQYGSFNPKLTTNITLKEAIIPNGTLPPNFDWRATNKVTYVKNQGSCSSDWAFSITGNIESLWAIKHNQLIYLSEKQLVDCDKSNNGCSRGSVSKAYASIKSMGGLQKEKDYPYVDLQATCAFVKNKVAVTISSAHNLTKDENQIANYLYKNGPVSIYLNNTDMQHYIDGISFPNNENCNTDVNHAALLVGYGISGNITYWIIKNSWGPLWGEEGYYRLHRGSNACGVASNATTAVL